MQQVKLADVLGKFIIPVNFLENWPPKCLAIQFATTQYIDWKTQTQINAGTCIFSNTELRIEYSNNQLQILYKVVYQQTPPKSVDSLFYMSTDLI